MAMNTCLNCGAGEIVTGALQSTGAVRFRPDDIKFLTFRTADISVRAQMCKACGMILHVGDVEKLRLLLSNAPSRSGGKPVGSKTA